MMKKDYDLSPEIQEVFLQGCSIKSGGSERVEEYLDSVSSKLPESVSWLDPLPLLEKIVIPLDVSHGREDFVVPYTQAKKFAISSRNSTVRTYITGLYHHTGTISVSQMKSLVWNLPKELWTSIRLVRSLVDLMSVHLGTKS
jgi:hypothetical protein